ncbi:arginyl-trna--protein transferase 1 [Stylonychia lemnae]|uniref:Arginyl-tRNA--protein transferase 1 n=1 Tax=Stylonychia lemnae TaxID=5949 RepID=A0A078B2M7_STYLE|nr:arginyl-trna--protein transferase 1 [Stylonychia lemnae]|eukprot:CDW88491.1 arginyl-trna--protein transferase 1 [Stylonychia lemnae]
MQTTQGLPKGKTIINLNGCHINENESGHCGYCGGKKGSQGAVQWGLVSNKMTVQDYQKLMDRGWRRCGGYYYKYDFEKSCCQPFTIRLNASEYQISQSQRKVMKKFNKFLLGQIGMDGKAVETKMQIQEESKLQQKQNEQDVNQVKHAQILSILNDITTNYPQQEVFEGISEQQYQELVKFSIINKSKDKQLKDTLSWSTNTLIKLFFQIKADKKDKMPHNLKSIKDFVNELRLINQLVFNQENSSVKIEDSGYLTFVNLEKDTAVEETKQAQKEKDKTQQKKSHKQVEEKKEDAKPEISKSQGVQENLLYQQYFKEHVPLELKEGQELKHSYTVTISKALYNKECFEVYSQYQQTVHKDIEKHPSGYKRFLCQNPLFDPKDQRENNFKSPQRLDDFDNIRTYKDEGVWPEHLGGYHMVHKIDGEVFAVGVIDITPNVLSSVYLYYNPKFEFLSPGVFTAVREIEYVQRIMEVFDPEFKYYYMGYYFQDCQKSVYKANYKPSQVLCPLTQNYVYLTDEIKSRITAQKLPLLCDDLPKIKELSLTDTQATTLAQNIKFIYQEQETLSISDLSIRYQPIILKLLVNLYQNIGLDLMMTCSFTF